MAGGEVRHSTVPPARRLHRWGAGLVVSVLLLAQASFVFDLGPRVLGWDHPSPVTSPAEVAPPPGLTLPSPSPAPVVASAVGSASGSASDSGSEPGSEPGSVDPVAVRRAIGGLLGSEDLGPRVAVAVGQISDGSTVFSHGPSRVVPASTMKLLTTTAALATLGPDHTFSTTAVAGVSSRDVVLVGGGDPLLARTPDSSAYPPRADIVTLAKATARSLKSRGRVRVRVGYDTSLFSGPSLNPAWPSSYVPDNVVSAISPLWVDGGRERAGTVFRAEDPALGAAVEFARALERQGIVVRDRPRPTVAATDALEYAAVQGAPLAQVVQWALEVSDNEAAEVLLRHVALATGRPGSFRGGAAAVREVLTELGVDLTGARILDGSGLSRRNRLAPESLLSVLQLAASPSHPELRVVVAGLPVAGYTGSLTYRFNDGSPYGLGRVRAKTGTLSGVHGLAGVLTDRDGNVLTFVAVADRVAVQDTLDARQRLDQVAAALAACSCSP
jgi:D-alanyl-D-alanine carboxypeptidase/D-alanyl-D-alanine-endopeptidase (penicillin-binding protein 4)